MCFLCRELCLCGSSGAPPPSTWDGPLETLPDVCGLYGGGGGGAEEPPAGGLLEDRAGFAELGGVGPLFGVGGRGFSLLYEEDVEDGAVAFWLGAGGALPRPALLKGGGGGGAEVLCFIPLPVEELLLLDGRDMSGSEGRCECWCSDGEGLFVGVGEVERPEGGRGAVGRDPGGLRADLPTEPPAGPSGWRTDTCFKT